MKLTILGKNKLHAQLERTVNVTFRQKNRMKSDTDLNTGMLSSNASFTFGCVPSLYMLHVVERTL